jgi:PAS domain-containing protein
VISGPGDVDGTDVAGMSSPPARQYRAWWLILPIVAVSAVLVILAGMRAGSDPGPGTIGVVAGIAVLAIVAIVATVLESRRIGRRFRHTIDELSRTQTEIRRLLDDLPDAVMGLNERGVIESANQRAALLTGRTTDELVGRAFLEMIGDDDRDSVTERWNFDQPSPGRSNSPATTPDPCAITSSSSWSTPTASRTWSRRRSTGRRCRTEAVPDWWCCCAT